MEKRAEMAAIRATQQSGRTEGEWNILFESVSKKIKRELRPEPSCHSQEFAGIARKFAPTAYEDALFQGSWLNSWYQK